MFDKNELIFGYSMVIQGGKDVFATSDTILSLQQQINKKDEEIKQKDIEIKLLRDEIINLKATTNFKWWE